MLGCGFVTVLGLMLLLKGKFYYVAPVYPIVFAPGAVLFEKLTVGAKSKWLRPTYAFLVLIVGALIAPTILPILPVKTFIAYSKKMGITQQKFENQPLAARGASS